jgi:hypothetical protein
LFIFYFLLNEEVRKFWREKKRKNRLKTSAEKGLNLMNLVIGKDEDYDETLDETFDVSDKEVDNKSGKKSEHKKSRRKFLKMKLKLEKATATTKPEPKSSHERFFIEPQEWEKNTTRRHSIVDIPGNTQEKITVL